MTGQTVSASASGGNRSLPSDGRTDETLWESKEDGADIGDGLILGHQLRSNSSEVHAAVQVTAFSDAQIGAEIYEQYDLESSGHIQVDGAGTYRGSAASGLAGGRIQGGVFIRESRSSIWSYGDYENGLDVNLGIVGGWGEHANWDCNMLSDEFYDAGTTVEIGVRLKLNASAVATSSAIVDLFTSASGDPILEVPGFFDFSYLDIDYQ